MSERSAIDRRAILFMLRQVASEGAKHVTEQDLQEIADIDEMELRRRTVRGRDWHRAFASCLDGIPEIKFRPGAAPDGCWEPRAIRSMVLQLLAEAKLQNATPAEEANPNG